MTKDDEKLVDKIEKMESSGMEITRRWHTIWDEGMRYFFSQHDNRIRKNSDWEFIVVNYIWPTAIQEIAKLAKNNPKIFAVPYTDDDAAAAEVWQGAVQWQWETALRMRLNQVAGLFCGKIFGYRVSKVFWNDRVQWDDEQKQWIGDVQYKLWHPALFWADGQENINDGNCGTVRWVTLDYAQSMWPKFKKEFAEIAVSTKSDEYKKSYGISHFRQATSSDGTHYEQDDDTDINKNSSVSTLLSLIDEAGCVTGDTDTKMVRISEVYFKDDEEKHVKEEQPIPAEQLMQMGFQSDGLGVIYDTQLQPLNAETWPIQTIREYDEPVYPYGRLILSAGCGQNRIILNPDKDSQRWGYKRWPFVVVPHYMLPFMWQGVNAVTLYKSTQDMINTSVVHMINNLKQFGDPRIAVEEGAIAANPKTKRPWSISSAAGAVLRLARGGLGKYRVEPPMPISPAAAGIYELFSQEYKNLTGMQAVAQGQQLRSGTTATEAQHLAVSSNDRIFLQSIYEDEWVKEVACLIAWTMQEYYDEGRWVRIVGQDKIEGIQQITTKEKSVKYDMKVEAGTTLPFDEEKRLAKYQTAYQLLENPTANPMLPEILRILEVPNWKKMLDELPAYIKYKQFVALYEQVKAGQVDPNQAVQMLVQAAMQEFAQDTGGMPPQQEMVEQ